jgi:hypothetical protein
MNLEASHYSLTAAGDESALNASLDASSCDDGAHFRRNLAANLLPSCENTAAVCDVSASEEAGAAPHRVLAFKQKAPAAAEGHASNLRVLYTQNKGAAPRVKATRHIPTAPERILDAPEMVDDYYLNLME